MRHSKKLYFQRHPNAPQHKIIIDKAVRDAIQLLTKHSSLGKNEEKALAMMGYKLIDIQSLIK